MDERKGKSMSTLIKRISELCGNSILITMVHLHVTFSEPNSGNSGPCLESRDIDLATIYSADIQLSEYTVPCFTQDDLRKMLGSKGIDHKLPDSETIGYYFVLRQQGAFIGEMDPDGRFILQKNPLMSNNVFNFLSWFVATRRELDHLSYVQIAHFIDMVILSLTPMYDENVDEEKKLELRREAYRNFLSLFKGKENGEPANIRLIQAPFYEGIWQLRRALNPFKKELWYQFTGEDTTPKPKAPKVITKTSSWKHGNRPSSPKEMGIVT